MLGAHFSHIDMHIGMQIGMYMHIDIHTPSSEALSYLLALISQSLFALVDPKVFASTLDTAQLSALKAWMAAMVARPGIAAFLKSKRCLSVLYDSVKNLA